MTSKTSRVTPGQGRRGNKVTDVGDAVFFEELQCVVSKSSVEGIEFPFRGIIDSHLEETRVRLVGLSGCDHDEEGCKGQQGGS
jgi:hypothetical protein